MRYRALAPALALAIAAAAAAAQTEVDQSRRNAIVRAIERAAPAVVTLNVVTIERQRFADPLFDDFWGFFGPGLRPFRERERAVASIGSGFLFDPQGYILTNYHVVEDADAIASVTLPGGRNLEVEFVGADERTDLAVLRAKGDNLPHARFGDSASLMVGEWAIAIGNPFGDMMRDTQPSVSVGVVSATHRRVSRDIGGGDRAYQDLIQTDAAINPGNSGGPLVNASGEVVGINTMIFSKTGGYQGLGFAIPAARAQRVAAEIIEFGRRRNPWMGFRGEAIAALQPFSLRQMGVTAKDGVLVTETLRDTPAVRAGLELGDVVTAMNGEPIAEPLDIDFLTWSLFAGDPVKLTLDRRGAALEIAFAIAELDRK